MIERDDLSLIVKTVSRSVRDYVGAAVVKIAERLDDFERRIKEIPAGPKGDPGADGLPGPIGEIGTSGADGINGKDGAVGPQGERGLPGVDGKDGAAGLSIKGDPGDKGVDGRDGRDAKDGRDGAQGRDALEIEILPEIDTAKSYPRGTFACYKGGLLHASRNTDTMSGVLVDEVCKSGWEIIINGIRDIALGQDGERKFSVRFLLTDGNTFVKDFALPVMIYRGIVEATKEYALGDTATYGGSLWHCKADSVKGGPAQSPASWQLVCKEGRAGKDGKDGKGGERGPEGKPGRDLTQMSSDGSKH